MKIQPSNLDNIDPAMLVLFREEVDAHAGELVRGMPALGHVDSYEREIEVQSRAIHSIKGAARLIGLDEIYYLADQIEKCIHKSSQAQLLNDETIKVLIEAVDYISLLSSLTTEPMSYAAQIEAGMEGIMARVEALNPLASLHAGSAPRDDYAQASGTSNNIIESTPPTDALRMTALEQSNINELFKQEVEQQVSVLVENILKLEDINFSSKYLDILMRSAHSIKGAARLVRSEPIVEVAHILEECFVAAQSNRIKLSANDIDHLLKASDYILLCTGNEASSGLVAANGSDEAHKSILSGIRAIIKHANITQDIGGSIKAAPSGRMAGHESSEYAASPSDMAEPLSPKPADRVLKISSEQLNLMMGLAGESMVEARWLSPFSESLQRIKREQNQLVSLVDGLRQIDQSDIGSKFAVAVGDVHRLAARCRDLLAERLVDLELFDRRISNISSRLHEEVVSSRMRPFADGVGAFPRMMRDLARNLNKEIQLNIDGLTTKVDRDILDRVEAPLTHLLRNAADHGIEFPHEREASGKPAKGQIRLSAYHHSGMLSIVVEDDGRGIDLERLRRKVVEKKMIAADIAENLDKDELLEFIFLPNFSTRDEVTEISGRGVGLDVVHDVVHEMRGMIRASSVPGNGTRFQLQLPLTLSVIPALIVIIADEPYAFPLASIDRIARIATKDLKEIEGLQYAVINGDNLGIVSARQIFGLTDTASESDELSVVIIGDRKNRYAISVDQFHGEKSLVVHVLPTQLGKIKNISSAAFLENGEPLLIIDIDDMLLSIDKIVKEHAIQRIGNNSVRDLPLKKSVLIADDSITVREVEKKLLEAEGYEVDVAVDGIDAINLLKEKDYDLLITDIDMPRMDGIELVKTLRKEQAFMDLPILIVSYKDREEDKLRGLQAGANYYLTKGTFHDQKLHEAVIDLIGEAYR